MGRPLNEKYFHQVGSSAGSLIKITANLGSGYYAGSIIKQKSSRSYKVQTQQGTGVVYLTGSAEPTAGHAYIRATDSSGNEYAVTKLTSHRATVAQLNVYGSPSGGWIYIGSKPWTTASPAPAGYVTVETY